jgi:uncharacterized membrane protein YcaP (DUF421 family)
MLDTVNALIGTDADTLLWWQMSIRTVLVFGYTLLLLRIGSQRALGRNASFDIVLSVILGSVMSRALTGNSSFFPTLLAATILVALHWLVASIVVRYPACGSFFKGARAVLIRDGQIQVDVLRRSRITENDLLEALRFNGLEDPRNVKLATLERNGDVSVVRMG